MDGRITLPEATGPAAWPNREGPLADIMNNLNKIVFSHTLEQVEWANSRLAAGSPAEEIARLKQQQGQEIGVAGGARFARSLSKEGLIDEYRLTIHPVVLGSGMPLFAAPLKLKFVNSRPLASGVVIAVYQRA